MNSATVCNGDDLPPLDRFRVPVRFLIVGLLLLGAFTSGITRGNMATTIIAMAPQSNNLSHLSYHTSGNHSNHSKSEPYCGHFDGIGKSAPGALALPPPEFTWTESMQDSLLGAFFIGYAFALIPSGCICEQYSGKIVAMVAGFLQTALNLATPFAARHSYILLIACRVILGVTSAMFIPAFYGLISRWVLDDEKSKAIAFLSVGNSLGSIVLNLVSGYLCENGIDGGWPSVFYLTGALSLIWLVMWYLVASNHPSDHHFISQNEMLLLAQQTSTHNTKKSTLISFELYMRMLRSGPVLALLYVKLTHAWFFNLLQSKLPQQMIAVLGMNLEQTSIWNTLFHAILFIACLSCGFLADCATKRTQLSRTYIRKSFETVSTFGIFLFLAFLATSDCNRSWFIMSMALAVACGGISTGGSSTVVVDLTSEYSATLIAVLSTMTQLLGFCTPHLVTLILADQTDLMVSWNRVFNTTALISFSGGIVFLVFGSAENQCWESSNDETPCEERTMPTGGLSGEDSNTGCQTNTITIDSDTSKQTTSVATSHSTKSPTTNGTLQQFGVKSDHL